MKLLRRRDIPEERYTNAFLGYGPEDSHFVIELTYSKLIVSLFFYFVSMSLNLELHINLLEIAKHALYFVCSWTY